MKRLIKSLGLSIFIMAVVLLIIYVIEKGSTQIKAITTLLFILSVMTALFYHSLYKNE